LTERLFCLTKTLTIRGLRWDQRSPHICWRDERGRQHQQSTQTDDPAKALAFKQDFQKENREAIQERRARTADQGRLPLDEAQRCTSTGNRDQPRWDDCARKADLQAD
jgi:hypothetical protein